MDIFGKKKQKSIDLLSDEDTGKESFGLLPIIIVAAIIILLQAIFAGSLFFLNLSTKGQIDAVKKQQQDQTTIWQKSATMATNVKTVVAKNTLYQTDLKSFSGLDTKLDKIRSLIPDGVTIGQIALDNKGKTSLSAQSAQAADGYQLVTVLQMNPALSNVNLDSISKQAGNYQFTITFLIIGN